MIFIPTVVVCGCSLQQYCLKPFKYVKKICLIIKVCFSAQ